MAPTPTTYNTKDTYVKQLYGILNEFKIYAIPLLTTATANDHQELEKSIFLLVQEYLGRMITYCKREDADSVDSLYLEMKEAFNNLILSNG